MTPPLRNRPTLMFYCQHSLGMGHLIRSIRLARALAADFRVLFLNGGRLPQDLIVPPGVEIIDLPPLGMDDDHTLVSRDAQTGVDLAKMQRRATIVDTYHRFKPAVVLIELFPFGRKKFAFELLPLLKAAKQERHRVPLVLCSVRDILVHDRPDQQRHDDRARWLCDRYFDAILVHADPKIARFSDSFRPSQPLQTPLHYTGFVTQDAADTKLTQRGDHILVSAGGGIVGGPLFRAAIEAQQRFGAIQKRTLRLVAGPFLPESEWLDLTQRVRQTDRVELIRSVPDLTLEMRRAAVSVSQCGYNTAMDVLSSRTPALVVPYAEGRENEQTHRAQQLCALGLMRMLSQRHLTPERLHAEINATALFAPDTSTLMLDGTAQSVTIIRQLMRPEAPLARHLRQTQAPDHVA